ncbi:Outer-membrane immunogenic protein [Rhodospirillaceae bacterium LM-1]|nr:Outer-membrane immunogenic protein [Rhodospirillaceae bacterium LM-1]
MRAYVVGLVASLIVGLSSGAVLAQSQTAIDWSGFYVGGLLGGTNTQAHAKTIVGVSKYLDATDAKQMARAGNNNLVQERPAGALLGGYGKQFGNVLVGIEASANTLFLDDEHTTSEVYDTVPTARFVLKQSVKADWMATLRPRLGWAQDNWLGYVTGGAAVTRLRLDTLFSDNAFNGFSQSSDKKYVAGWSLGLGGEYALGNDWSLRGEYLYTRFGQLKSSSETTSTNNSGGSLAHLAEFEAHGVMAGLTYRFKGF